MPRKKVTNQRSNVSNQRSTVTNQRNTTSNSRPPTNNRVKPLQDKLIGTEEAFEIMAELSEVLADTETPTPIPGKTYVFEYYAATPGLLYDRYPFVTVVGIYEWGFTGVNRHLKARRNYVVSNAGTQLYEVKTSEFDSLQALPLMEMIQN